MLLGDWIIFFPFSVHIFTLTSPLDSCKRHLPIIYDRALLDPCAGMTIFKPICRCFTHNPAQINFNSEELRSSAVGTRKHLLLIFRNLLSSRFFVSKNFQDDDIDKIVYMHYRNFRRKRQKKPDSYIPVSFPLLLEMNPLSDISYMNQPTREALPMP